MQGLIRSYYHIARKRGPTEHLSILEPQNPPIDISKRQNALIDGFSSFKIVNCLVGEVYYFMSLVGRHSSHSFPARKLGLLQRYVRQE